MTEHRLTDERISDLWSWSMTAEAEKTATTQQHAFARAIEAELSKQEPVARPRLPRIDHFAREAFEKFASGVECELTNYRWFEAGWDARGDTVAAAPLPSAPDTVQVPREPTEQMIAAGAYARNPEVRKDLSGSNDSHRLRRQVTRMWSAMIAAAPKNTP